MTRVAFVLQEPTPYRTPQLAAFAARDDVDATVVYAARTVQRRSWETPPPEEGVVYLSGPSLPLTRVLHHDYAVTPGVWPLLSRLRPQVVVVGGWSLMATQVAVAWSRTHRVPYLLMSDNHLLEPRPPWVRALKRTVLTQVVPPAAGWLVPGTLAAAHIRHYGARPERTVVFPLTVDVDAVARRTDELRARRDDIRAGLGAGADATVVLHVGRLIAHKAADVLVRAVAHAGNGRSLHLVVVGDGPEEHAVRSLAAELRVTATFRGHLEPDALLEAYVAADVFALLSRRETWGVVVNEAAAAGLPLVLSRGVGAAADLLEPGSNGELVEPDDAAGAAEAIAGLADDPALRARYGARSRELVAAWGYAPGVQRLAELVAEVAR